MMGALLAVVVVSVSVGGLAHSHHLHVGVLVHADLVFDHGGGLGEHGSGDRVAHLGTFGSIGRGGSKGSMVGERNIISDEDGGVEIMAEDSG